MRHEKIVRWCDRTMTVSFYALIYFLPISIALTETFSGLAVFCYLFKRGATFFCRASNPSREQPSFFLEKIFSFLKAFKPVDNYLNRAFAVFLLVNFITIFAGQDPSVSFEGFMGKILQGVFIYFTFLECMTSLQRVRTFLIVFSISALLMCVNGLFQYFVGHDFIYGHVFDGRISSSLRQANDFAAYLVIVVPALFCLSVLMTFDKGRKLSKNKEGISDLSFLSTAKTRIIMLILLAAAVANLGLTYSRGAWVGFIVCLLFFGLRSWRWFLSAVLAVAVFLALFYPQLNQMRPAIKNRGSFMDHNNRLRYWSRSLCVIKDYPFLGSGVNTYSSVQWRYNVGLGGYPHNSYLQMTAETGFIGLFSFLAVIFALYKSSLREIKRMENTETRFLLVSFLTALTGFLIHSFFDTNFYSVQLGSLMWSMVGLIVALQKIRNREGYDIPLMATGH